MKYAVVIERGTNRAMAPKCRTCQGCVAAAETRDEVCALIREAIELYVEALRRRRPPCAGTAHL